MRRNCGEACFLSGLASTIFEPWHDCWRLLGHPCCLHAGHILDTMLEQQRNDPAWRNVRIAEQRKDTVQSANEAFIEGSSRCASSCSGKSAGEEELAALP